VPKFTPNRPISWHFVLMDLAQVIFSVGLLAYLAALAVARRSGRSGISHHPYMDPYGDTPGASRGSPVREVRESIHSAPGTR
jgi:hypothetical protein